MSASGECAVRDRSDCKPHYVAEVFASAVFVNAAFASPLFLPVVFACPAKFVTEACLKSVTAIEGPVVASVGKSVPAATTYLMSG